MDNELILSMGVDIPFPSLRLNIHQPKLKEIALIGEESFFLGCEFLTFSKEKFLSDEDKNNLKDTSDFDVLMSILKNKNLTIQKSKVCATMLLTLLFPDYLISFQEKSIAFKKVGEDEIFEITNDNFEDFKEILTAMFCLKRSNNEGLNYNPGNDAARELAERFRKNRAKIAEMKGETKKVSILSRYSSILVVGQKKDYNSFLDYTVYQIFDEFERFEMKEQYDFYLKAKMAGAKDLDDVEYWMKNIHP